MSINSNRSPKVKCEIIPVNVYDKTPPVFMKKINGVTF
jgi:hypothetical protein